MLLPIYHLIVISSINLFILEMKYKDDTHTYN